MTFTMNEQDGQICLVSIFLHKDSPVHVLMTSRLKHESTAEVVQVISSITAFV